MATGKNNDDKLVIGGMVLVVVAAFSLWNPIMNAKDNIYDFIHAVEGLKSGVFSDLVWVSGTCLIGLPFVCIFGAMATALFELHRYTRGLTSARGALGDIFVVFLVGYGFTFLMGLCAGNLPVPPEANLLSMFMLMAGPAGIVFVVLLTGSNFMFAVMRRGRSGVDN